MILMLLLTVLASPPARADEARTIVPFEKNAAVSGKLFADSACAGRADEPNPQVWLSIGQTLLFQVEVPVNGSFEFHLVPGKYELTATNSKGCLVRTPFQVASGKVETLDLKLEPARSPASGGGK